mgnify:CR=1 FL=1
MQSRHGSTRLWNLSVAASLALPLGLWTPACYDGVARDPQGLSPEEPGEDPDQDPILDRDGPPPELDALSPNPAPGGVEFDLRVTGAGFDPDTVVVLAGLPLPTTLESPGELLARCGPLPRGEYPVHVRRGAEVSRERALQVGNAAPRIVAPAAVTVAEDEPLVVTVDVADVDDPASVRVHALGLPPGALWDEPSRTLRFTPDFIQGGERWTVTLLADDGEARVEASVDVDVLDTIQPPAPAIVATDEFAEHVRLTLSQVTDDYLDSPGFAGREFAAVVTVPVDPPPEGVPVRVGLHGFGTPEPSTSGSSREIRIAPHDPDNTYWWGYARSLPLEPPTPGGEAPDYTARRVLHLVEWVLRSFPEADPERVYLFGSSMGGAGAMTIGLVHARHFAYVDARLGQAIPRNHRPARLQQLSELWGAPDLGLAHGGMSAWDFMDLTRALAEDPRARDQFLFTKHGKDDPTIHFGAAVLPSPLTGDSLYDALQVHRVGHFAVWDEGGHGDLDPVLGGSWWSSSWSPIHGDGDGDTEARLRRDQAFPAFSSSSHDDDPGTGDGNGKQSWSPNRGYAGDVPVPGDTGWDGDLAGALGRWLRWDAASVVDTVDRFQVAVRVVDGDGAAPPKAGYPSKGDRLSGDLPVRVDITPRRTRAFRCLPGERVTWSFGKDRGEVVADETGAVTIPALPLTTSWRTLTLRRHGLGVTL